jgi:hypothetical protein
MSVEALNTAPGRPSKVRGSASGIWLEGLELDGFNEDLRLAFEYNGEQHYRVVPFFHANGAADLAAQRARDGRKAEICHDNMVVLVVVPHWTADRAAFIRKAVSQLGCLA